jgi:hypothetical protein
LDFVGDFFARVGQFQEPFQEPPRLEPLIKRRHRLLRLAAPARARIARGAHRLGRRVELGVLAAVELLRGWGYERSFGPREDLGTISGRSREDLIGVVLVVLFGG